MSTTPLSQRTAPEEIGRILDRPPLLSPQVLRGDTRLTQRWAHGGLHNHLKMNAAKLSCEFLRAPIFPDVHARFSTRGL